MGAISKKIKAKGNAANQQADAATTALSQAGVNTAGMTRDSLVAQYNNGYSMITERNQQTKNDFFSNGGSATGSGSAMSRGETALSAFLTTKKKTLLGGYLGSNAVLGG